MPLEYHKREIEGQWMGSGSGTGLMQGREINYLDWKKTFKGEALKTIRALKKGPLSMRIYRFLIGFSKIFCLRFPLLTDKTG